MVNQWQVTIVSSRTKLDTHLFTILPFVYYPPPSTIFTQYRVGTQVGEDIKELLLPKLSFFYPHRRLLV